MANAASDLRWSAPATGKQLPFATFLPLLQQAVATAPERVDLQLQLARTLLHTERMTELVERFRPLAARAGADPELLFHLGRGASSLGEDALALTALRASAAGGFEPAFGYLAEALHRAARPDDALAAALRGLERAPSDFMALRIAALVLRDRGENDRLWDVCTELRARGAWGAYLPSVMALAATTPEQQRELAALIDPAGWFSAAQLDVPADFNRLLAAELLAHDALGALPAAKATRGSGGRIDQLHLAGGPLAQELLARVRTAAAAYAAQRQALAPHPMVAHRPAAAGLNSWAVAVHDDGHESWHLHPDGWLSGVYYVAVPPAEPRAGERPGAIEFGPHPFGGYREDSAWRRWHVVPRAGLLLLFPSYYAHRTWPTGSAEPRVCIAFDVIPGAV